VLGLKKEEHQTVMDFVDTYFEKFVLNNQNVAPGTTKVYRRSINHLKAFLQAHYSKETTLDKINYAFASDFKIFLVSKNILLDRAGITEVSAAGVIKKFRTIFTHALDLGLIKSNPFKQVKIQTKSPRRQRLSIEQVVKIYKLDLTLWPTPPLYRDIFLFSVFTGLGI
jgi:site-specific recombinase XerD